MRLNLALIISIIVAVGLVALGFTIYQSSTERNNLNDELAIRTSQIADAFYKNDLLYTKENSKGQIEHFTDSISGQYQLLGIAIYYNDDSIITSNELIRPIVTSSLDYISRSINADTSVKKFIQVKGRKVYQFIKPLKKNGIANNVIIFYTDAQYIDNIIGSIWLRNFLRAFIQALLVSFIIILIIRWGDIQSDK